MSAPGPWSDEAGSERSLAVRKLLAEACRALEFDRAHVVLVGDRACTRELPRLLAAELAGEIETVVVQLAGHEEGVADRVAEAIREARRQAPAGDAHGDDPTAPRRARLALLLPDALSIPSASLRTLSEMAMRSGMTQRLVLLVDRDATPVEDPARELVRRLGVGISKIELEPEGLSRIPPRIIRPEELDASPRTGPMPPVVSDTRARRMRPVRVRARRRPGGGAPLRWILSSALVAGTALFLGAPGLVRQVVIATVPAHSEIARAPERAAEPQPALESEPTEPQRAERQPPVEPEKPTPQEPARVEASAPAAPEATQPGRPDASQPGRPDASQPGRPKPQEPEGSESEMAAATPGPELPPSASPAWSPSRPRTASRPAPPTPRQRPPPPTRPSPLR